jgi:hypothetical protein
VCLTVVSNLMEKFVVVFFFGDFYFTRQSMLGKQRTVGISIFLRNVGTYVPDYMASNPR